MRRVALRTGYNPQANQERCITVMQPDKQITNAGDAGHGSEPGLRRVHERHDPDRIRVGLNPTEAARTTMRSTQQFSITLPNEMAEAVRAKVAAGEYATESEVIRDGLRVLLARDRAVENWLRKDVAAAYDALKARTRS